MKNKDRVSIKKKINSFKYALDGLGCFIKSEHSAIAYLVGAFLSIFLGFYFRISRYEWLIQVLITAFIFSAELFNTAIERVVDLISPNYHPLARKAKDLASSAVLLALIGGFFVFLLIYYPLFMKKGLLFKVHH